MSSEPLMVRERILNQITKDLYTLKDFGGNPLFYAVERAPLEIEDSMEHNAIAVVDLGDINVIYELSYILPTMRVAFEFTVEVLEGDVASKRLNQVLSLLHNYLLRNLNITEDNTDAQLAINVKYSSFEPDISSYQSRFASGVVIYEITYRHGKQDATELR